MKILTIPGVDLIIIIEGVTVIITIRILDKDNITVILNQEIKQLAITINGDAKPISGIAQIELKRLQGKASKVERTYRWVIQLLHQQICWKNVKSGSVGYRVYQDSLLDIMVRYLLRQNLINWQYIEGSQNEKFHNI